MKRIVRLTESDLTRIVRRVIKEEECLETPKWLVNFTIGQSKMSVVCNYLTWYSKDYNEGSGFKVLVDLEKTELAVTVCSMDGTLGGLKSISGGKKGTNPSNECPEFIYTFSNSKENGDLNRMLDNIKDILSSDVNKLKESDLTRIVKETINENINQSSEDFRSISRRVSSALDDLVSDTKKGDTRKVDESIAAVKHHIRKMEGIIDDLKKKLR